MPRAPKQCGRFGCTEAVTGRTYCVEHEAERQALMTAKRGNFRQRGYDAQHDREAKAAKAKAIRERATCPRCGQPILEGQALDYGHSVARHNQPGSRADRVEHAHCNRSAQARD
jgi:hypothetical protein